MKRLTDIDPYWMGEETWLSAREPGEDAVDKVYEKLWKYENTGLEPDEIDCRIPRWISVEEDLPKDIPYIEQDMDNAVLLYTPVDGYIHIGWYGGKNAQGRNKWYTLTAMRSSQHLTKKVTHWMPRPKSPKESE